MCFELGIHISQGSFKCVMEQAGRVLLILLCSSSSNTCKGKGIPTKRTLNNNTYTDLQHQNTNPIPSSLQITYPTFPPQQAHSPSPPSPHTTSSDPPRSASSSLAYSASTSSARPAPVLSSRNSACAAAALRSLSEAWGRGRGAT
jgi:hypothetical protein